MNNIYVICEGEIVYLVEDVEQNRGGSYLAAFDDSLSLEADEPGRARRVERRRHQRFHLNKNAYALIRPISAEPLNIQGKSMGCIACAVFNARPARLGKIENISMGGLMFQHVAGEKQLNRTFVLEILAADCAFHLANIPFKIKADIVLPDDIPDSPFEMRQVRLQFQKLNADQQARLKELLINNGMEADFSAPV